MGEELVVGVGCLVAVVVGGVGVFVSMLIAVGGVMQ